MRHMTASAEVTPHATLCACVMQERLELFASLRDRPECWDPKPSLPGGCAGHFSQTAQKTMGQRAPQAGMKALPQRPPLELLPGARLSCRGMELDDL